MYISYCCISWYVFVINHYVLFDIPDILIYIIIGPYHPKEAYVKVNYNGTVNILNAAKKHNVLKIVMSSSPSTRFPYPDPNILNLTEDELKIKNGGEYAKQFLQPYAETKAMGEKVIRDACDFENGKLLTIAVAPHQVYGPRDTLFLPSLLQTAKSGKLRVFGDGNNIISFTHVDNYCHGLILGAEALYPNSPALGKFYIVTDDTPQKFWHVLDDMIKFLQFTSIFSKMKLPGWLMMLIAYIAVFLGNIYAKITGTPEHIVNFTIKLNPFAVKMLLIHRAFNISAAKRDLKYKPIKSFEQGWKETGEWFRDHWLS